MCIFLYFFKNENDSINILKEDCYLASSTFIFIHHCTLKGLKCRLLLMRVITPLVGNDSVFTPTPHLFIINLITIICHCQIWNGVFPFNCRANLWKMWLFSFVRASWWSFLSPFLEPYCYVLWFFFSSKFSSVIIKILFCNLSKFLLLGKVIRMSRQLSVGGLFNLPFPNSHLRRTAHYLYPSRRIEVKRALVCLFEYTKTFLEKGYCHCHMSICYYCFFIIWSSYWHPNIWNWTFF